MRIAKNKKTTVIALILVFTFAISLVALPTANAHTPAWQIPTHAYIIAVPNPIGVGQKLNIIMFLDKTIDGAAYGNDIRFHNYKLTITKPNGDTETKVFDVVQDTTSGQYYSYVPDQTGNYTFKFDFPAQTYTYTGLIYPMMGPPAPSDYVNDTYLASSASAKVTVQEEPVTVITSYPLPKEYWTRPIYGEDTDWWSISSNWYGTGSPQYTSYNNGYTGYVSDAIGSQTAHVMWTKQLQSGGVVGGNKFVVPGDTFFEGSAYIPRYVNPIILDGKIYYNEPVGFSGGNTGPTVCVDLRTGEIIWSRTDVPQLSFGYIYDNQNQNQHGVLPPILISTGVGGFAMGPAGPTTWQAYDADTGDWLFNATNVPSGAKAMGPQGEYISYVIANAGDAMNPDYRLLQWNSSKLAITGIVDASTSNCYDWNISIPWLNTMPTTIPGMNPATVVAAYTDDVMLCYNGSLPALGYAFSANSWTPYTYFAVNLNASKGAVGSVLWMHTYDPPAGNITVVQGGVDPVGRVFLEAYKETAQWVGYSLDTGQKLWGPTASQTAVNSLDYYGTPGIEDRTAWMAYGKVYSSFFSGIMYCYDEKTGNLLWTYGNGGAGNSTNAGLLVGRGWYPTAINAIGNGVIYTITTEHTITTPIYKGALVRAINATDGTEVWTLSSFTASFHSISYAIADGFSTWFNGYDNSIYVVGRGPSKTTVTAPDVAAAFGTPVEIKGSVMDICTGTTQDAQAARFPNGIPAVSDASMSDWMGYVYQGRPIPANVTGVTVSLDVIDSNGNFRNIGTTTTDPDGFFHYAWKPDIPGEYIVYASFAGSKGYWPSHAVTAFDVMEAAQATPSPTPVTQAPVETYFTVSTVAIIIAIAIAVVLLLRKRA